MSDPHVQDGEFPRRRPRRWALLGTAALVIAVAVGGMLLLERPEQRPAGSRLHAATATVTRGDLSGTVRETGQLDYQNVRPLAATMGGVITQLPAPGATVGLGGALYDVDNVPVYLFIGALPAWRGFGAGMSKGPDVQQLETSLSGMGLFTRSPDTEFDRFTARALSAWQKATGQAATGALDLGRVVFAPGPVRIVETKAQAGDASTPGAPIATISDLSRTVTAKLGSDRQGLVRVGGHVTVILPDGRSVAATVRSVDPAVEQGEGAQRTTVIPVTLAFDDDAALGEVQRSAVSIDIPTESRKGVLSVPVDALLALATRRFAVEVMGRGAHPKTVAVKVGMFAAGRVEVSGTGLAEGLRVVVPR